MITDRVSIMKTPARITKNNSNLPITARTPSNPPIASEPVSPIKILAGFLLKYKKPTHAALAAIEIIAKNEAPISNALARKYHFNASVVKIITDIYNKTK